MSKVEKIAFVPSEYFTEESYMQTLAPDAVTYGDMKARAHLEENETALIQAFADNGIEGYILMTQDEALEYTAQFNTDDAE